MDWGIMGGGAKRQDWGLLGNSGGQPNIPWGGQPNTTSGASPTTWLGDGTPPGMPRLPNGQSYQHGSQLGPAQPPPWYNPSMGALPQAPGQVWGANGQVTYQGGVPAIKAYNQAMSQMRKDNRAPRTGGMFDAGYQGNPAQAWASMSPEQQAYWQANAGQIDPTKQYRGTQQGGQGGGPGSSGIQQLIASQPWNGGGAYGGSFG